MSLHEWAIGQAKLGNLKAARAGLKLRGKYGELPVSTGEQDIQSDPTKKVSNFAAEFFSTQLHTPENLTKVRDIIWASRQASLEGSGIWIDLTFEPCTYSQEEIDVLEASGRRVGYLPPELATQEQRHLLGVIFPHMQSHDVQTGNTVTNEVDRFGWFDYEASVHAPHLFTTEDVLRKVMEKEDGLGMNLNEYIIASNDSKVLTGEYLDESRTWSRLLGSRRRGYVMNARFDGNGSLHIYSAMSLKDQGGDLGGRFVRVPKAA